MKHIFVINPAAGKRDGRQKIYEMAETLRTKHGLDVECVLTRNPGHATELTRKIAESGIDVRFYACGGDGTISEVAEKYFVIEVSKGVNIRVAKTSVYAQEDEEPRK